MDIHPSQLEQFQGVEILPAIAAELYRAPLERDIDLAPVDRATFNYGRALGSPQTAEYVAFAAQARAWATVASQFSRGAWALDLALKFARDAETREEQARAMTEARRVFHEYDRKLERVESGPCKWFRYGRVGNVLRKFRTAFAKG